LYSGFAERWPQTWTDDNTLGTVTPTAVDAFALLSQYQLTDPLSEELGKYNPRFVYRMDDPDNSSAAVDATGNNIPAQVQHGKYGTIGGANINFGTAITATDPINGVYTGSSGTVATIANPSPGQNVFGSCAYLSLDSAGITGPVASSTGWTRVIAFRYTGPTPAYSADIWSAYDSHRDASGVPNGSTFALFINGSGQLIFNTAGPTSGTFSEPFNPSVPSPVDGNWHFVMIIWDPVGAALHMWADGLNWEFDTFNPAAIATGLTMDSVGAFVDKTKRYTTANFAGDIAFVAEFPTALTTGTQRLALYNAWKNSFSGDSTDVRYGRILDYAGYTGNRSIGTGSTTSMGPANIGGQDALSALQSVVDTENGEHFVSADGTVIFRSRAARYNTLTPTYVFGENTAGGEWPYETLELDHDPTHLGNIAQVTQEASSAIFTVVDSASQAQYFPRTLQRTINASSTLECQDAAAYLVSRYKQPQTRVNNLVLHPAAYPALWPVALSIELGMRIRVIRRPLGRASITLDLFVEQKQWNVTADGDATLSLQCSPADLTPYGVFQAWHSTLTATAGIGATTLTVNSAVGNPNQLQAQQGLTLGGETVTVSSVSGSVITLNGPTTLSHAIGDPVVEFGLAAGVNPATWDGQGIFDFSAFTY
jgi:hypothetical protein